MDLLDKLFPQLTEEPMNTAFLSPSTPGAGCVVYRNDREGKRCNGVKDEDHSVLGFTICAECYCESKL